MDNLSQKNIKRIQKPLSRLAFNLTQVRRTDFNFDKNLRALRPNSIYKQQAVSWLFNIMPRQLVNERKYAKIYSLLWSLNPVLQYRAKRILPLAEGANLIVQTEKTIAFKDLATQYYFCYLYCNSRTLNKNLLLKMTKGTRFEKVWSIWAEQNKEVVNRLQTLLVRNKDIPVKISVVQALGNCGDSRGVPILLSIIRDNKNDEALRKEASWNLSKLADLSSIDLLIAALKNEAADKIKTHMAISIGNIGEQAIQKISDLLNDNNIQIRSLAIEALARTNSITVVPILTILLSDPIPEIRTAAAKALGTLANIRRGNLKLDFLIECPEDELLRTLQNKAIEPLINSLQDRNPDVVVEALTTLGIIGDKKALLPIVSLINSPNTQIKYTTTLVLCWIGDVTVVPQLASLLNDKDDEISENAEFALLEIGKEAVDSLLAILEVPDTDPTVQSYIIGILGAIGDKKACETILKIWHRREDHYWHAMITKALIQLGDDNVFQFVLDRLNNPNELVRQDAISALGNYNNNTSLELLLKALNDKDSSVRTSAARSLGKLGRSEAITPLLQILKDDEASVRYNAALALGKIGNSEILPALEWTQRNDIDTFYDHLEVRDAATKAIELIKQKSGVISKGLK